MVSLHQVTLRLGALWHLLSSLPRCSSQKGIASLNDPCDCFQHHDFWVSSRSILKDMFSVDNFPFRMFDPEDTVHDWVMTQSCMYSPENEESHRPTALSDCIPGFLLLHIVCMQRHLADRQPKRAMDFATELMRLLPFGRTCLDESAWSVKGVHIERYYRRVRRAFAAGPPEGEPWPQQLLRDMAWIAPTENEDEQEVNLGDEPEVCASGTLPDAGVCWVLGAAGDDCEKTCRIAQMRFEQPLFWPGEPLVPRLIGLFGGLPEKFFMQRDWAPFECWVSSEGRFHTAADAGGAVPGDWSYPLCELACPCAPVLHPSLREALAQVPTLRA